MDLTTVCHCVPEAVTQVVDKLINLNFVARRHCSEDRRVIHLDITPAGTTAFDTIIKFATEPIRSPKPKLPRQKSKYEWDRKKKASPSHPAG
jgi:DNA-binding MarR family transcriptional regulator